MDYFLLELALYAWGAAFLLSFSTSTLGCFVLWRRMSYFGDTLAHGSMLGFSLAIVLQINFTIGLIFTVLFITALLYFIERKGKVLHMDSILGIVAHLSLSLGFIIISIMARYVRVDVLDYLFGDLLAVKTSDIYVIAGTAVVVVSIFALTWRKMLMCLISEELAKIEGINVDFYKSLTVFLLALTVAISITMIGALLITSLLIIPASTARRFAKTPREMLVFSFIISNIAFICGILASIFLNVPTSPSIVVALGIMFFLSLSVKRGLH